MSGGGRTRGRPKGSGIDDSEQLAAIARLIVADPGLKPTTAIKAIGVSDPSIIRRLRDKYSELQQQIAAPSAFMPSAGQPADAAASPGREAIAVPSSSARPRAHALAARSQPAARRTAAPSAVVNAAKSTVSAAKLADRTVGKKPRSVSATPATPDSGKADVAQSSEPESKPVMQQRAAPAHHARPESTPPDREATRGSPFAASRQAQADLKGTQIDGQTRQYPPSDNELVVSLCGFGIAAASSALSAQASFAETFLRTSLMSLVLRQQVAFNEWALQLTPWSAVKTQR